jgi:nuclear pore complex protein Nup133
MICGSELFIWSYSSSSIDKKCVALDIPSSLVRYNGRNHWNVCVVKRQGSRTPSKTEIDMVFNRSPSVGIILCNLTSQGIVYWPDIFSERRRDPIFNLPKGAEESSNGTFSSIITAPVAGNYGECIAIACQPNGILWSFEFSQDSIYRRKVSESLMDNGGYVRSLVWKPKSNSSDMCFFLLTDNEVQYWSVIFSPSLIVKNMWTHIVVGDDGDLGIKKDLAGQKHVWLLDLQVDERGRELSILVATFCKDRASSSNFTQYSLLTMLYNKPPNTAPEQREPRRERILEKKAPLQVIIPKAQVEDEEILFSMKLRVGGKPSGSVAILSADGTATVAHYWRGSMRLYQFDLPWDAGKVLDASILPSAEETEVENEGGAWVVLTEKAGIWAIPEKSVLVGGVEPPERSLSRKGSSNESIKEEEKRLQAFGAGKVVPRRVSSEAWRSGSSENRQRTVFSGVPQRGASDEEVEALLFRSFHDFVLSDKIEEHLQEKLGNKGAFDKEGETNVFARTSRSIVDTLAKHWTTSRGADIVASTVISSLLVDKQQKHQKFLQFLALSKCHGELSLKQSMPFISLLNFNFILSPIAKGVCSNFAIHMQKGNALTNQNFYIKKLVL